MITDPTSVHDREAAFHDNWARGSDLSAIKVRECFEAPTAMENQFILAQMGSLAGMRVLDVGAGLGESSVYFALKGARVTVTDISPGMIETALRLGELHGVRLEGLISTGEGLNVEPESYDIVYLANVIHHIHDRAALFAQVYRALKTGGRFFSIDPLAYNPAINQYRRMATETRTPDETPLTTGDVKMARQFFPDVKHREFWITSLILFAKYFLLDNVHPNKDRYWKRILTETDASLGWWKPLRAIDATLTRIPGVRWLAWNTVMFGTKPA